MTDSYKRFGAALEVWRSVIMWLQSCSLCIGYLLYIRFSTRHCSWPINVYMGMLQDIFLHCRKHMNHSTQCILPSNIYLRRGRCASKLTVTMPSLYVHHNYGAPYQLISGSVTKKTCSRNILWHTSSSWHLMFRCICDSLYW